MSWLPSCLRVYCHFHCSASSLQIFWLIEPSLTNIRLYEEFVRNPEQTGFFGNVVDKCARIVLNPGTTTIIPSGEP